MVRRAKNFTLLLISSFLVSCTNGTLNAPQGSVSEPAATTTGKTQDPDPSPKVRSRTNRSLKAVGVGAILISPSPSPSPTGDPIPLAVKDAAVSSDGVLYLLGEYFDGTSSQTIYRIGGSDRSVSEVVTFYGNGNSPNLGDARVIKLVLNASEDRLYAITQGMSTGSAISIDVGANANSSDPILFNGLNVGLSFSMNASGEIPAAIAQELDGKDRITLGIKNNSSYPGLVQLVEEPPPNPSPSSSPLPYDFIHSSQIAPASSSESVFALHPLDESSLIVIKDRVGTITEIVKAKTGDLNIPELQTSKSIGFLSSEIYKWKTLFSGGSLYLAHSNDLASFDTAFWASSTVTPITPIALPDGFKSKQMVGMVPGDPESEVFYVTLAYVSESNPSFRNVLTLKSGERVSTLDFSDPTSIDSFNLDPSVSEYVGTSQTSPPALFPSLSSSKSFTTGFRWLILRNFSRHVYLVKVSAE